MLAGGQLRADGSEQRAASSEQARKKYQCRGRPRSSWLTTAPRTWSSLEAILSSLEAILVPVRSGEQAVLLDIMMPRVDGFDPGC